MPVWVVLLRGINVGGKNLISMESLRSRLDSNGWSQVRTLLQSGNVVGWHDATDQSEVEEAVETVLFELAGKPIRAFCRSQDCWDRYIQDNPMTSESLADPSHTVLMLFERAPTVEACDSLSKAIKGNERFKVLGDVGYFYYPDGIGDSKLTPKVIESHFGPATGRNWNTVLKIQGLLSQQLWV